MGNMLKQRLIKPGRDFNYSEGQKVKAAEAIVADQIVYISGSEGPFSIVSRAYADVDSKHSEGRLLIAKHDIPANGYGVCVPWKLVTRLDTSAAAVGDPVYLRKNPGGAALANITLTPQTGAGTTAVIIGRVTVADTVANGAAIMVQAANPESRLSSGSLLAGSTVSPSPAETFTLAVDVDGSAGTQSVDLTAMPFPVVLLDAYVIAAGTGQPQVDVKNNAGAKALETLATANTAGAVARAVKITRANVNIAAGEKITLTKANGNDNDIVVLTMVRT